MVKTSDFRAIRGLTIALCVADEVAFWDGQGVNPDKEIFTALRPSMATIPGSKLLCISTAYAKAGVLFEAYREDYGHDDEHALVWQADTRTMNPTLSETLIQRELEKDPDSARAEWLGVFREDLEAAASLEALEACVIRGRDELPPSQSISYRAFVDPSGGRRDAYTLAIGHREGQKAANYRLTTIRAFEKIAPMYRILASVLIAGWVILSGFDLIEDLDEVPGQVAISTAPSQDAKSPKLGGWGTFANNMVECAHLGKQNESVRIEHTNFPCSSFTLVDVLKTAELHKLHHVLLI